MTADEASEKLRRSWTANAEAWTSVVRGQKIESRRLGTDEAILSAVLDQKPRTVLDLGCGEGWLTRSLSEHGVATAGVDISPELIRAAEDLGGGSFRACAYEDLVSDPVILSGPFDVIVANFSLLDEPLHDLLLALRGRLRSKGSLVVQTVHPAFSAGDYVDGWRVETFAAVEGDWREPMPWYFRTLTSWVQTFTDAGFEVAALHEPPHPQEHRPLSIIFVCCH